MAYLQIETRDGVRQVPLNRNRVSIGRLASNDVTLPYQHISRYHAELQREDGTWWIADLHSTNGLQVSGQRVDRHPLGPGERVLLAPGITVHIVAEAGDDHDPAASPTALMPSMEPVDASSFGTPGLLGAPRPGLPGAGAPAGVVNRAAPPVGPAAPDPGSGGDPPAARGPAGAGGAREWVSGPRASAWPGQASAGGGGVRGGRPRPSRHTGEPTPDDPREGDLFRRSRSQTGAPAQNGSPQPAGPLAHLCQTCGQLTAPDVVYCLNCHNSIARPCRGCDLSLLPIQDRCPRCNTLNAHSVFRSRRGQTGA